MSDAAKNSHGEIRYNQMMSRVSVTPDMRSRIMAALNAASASAGGKKNRQSRSPRLLPHYRAFPAAAACLLLLVGAVFLLTKQHDNPVQPVPEDVMTPWGATVYEDAAALSQAVGFPIDDLSPLPLTPDETVYQRYSDNMAEILYRAGEQSISYRVSKGSEDNSGDYTEYQTTYRKTVGGVDVTMSGNDGLIYKATFERGGYSYSVTATEGLSEAQLVDMVEP